MNMANSETEASKHYVLFIDVLYAVVVGETIFTYGEELFNIPSISTLALVVTYISIISSFIFWHNAISKYPHQKPYRFFVDIIVLIVYLGIMFNHSKVDTLFYGFAILYFLYLVWDFLTRREYDKTASRLKTSARNLIIMISVFIMRQLLIYLQTLYPQISTIFVDVTSLVVLAAFILTSQIQDILKVVKMPYQPKGNSVKEKAHQPKR
jgi:cytochrome c oxidase assembly factor CtaG